MTNQEFQDLKELIDKKMFELEHLQEVYRRETGKEYAKEIKLSPNWEREVSFLPIWARRGGDNG